MTAPLRIGLLRAARIAGEGIIAPAPALGHEVVAGDGRPLPDDLDGSVATAELIDECYRRAGLVPRGSGRGP